MLKAKFIDKILEALGFEAGKIEIYDNNFLIYFYSSDDKEGNREIVNLISSLELSKTLEDYKIVLIKIDYGLNLLEIWKRNTLIVSKDLKVCGPTRLWTTILEEIEKDKVKMEEEQQ